MAMKSISPTEIPRAAMLQYSMWDGEMGVTVFQHVGVHGFPSAVIVVTRMDAPIDIYKWDGYHNPKPTDVDMRAWVADRLNELANVCGSEAHARSSEIALVGMLGGLYHVG